MVVRLCESNVGFDGHNPSERTRPKAVRDGKFLEISVRGVPASRRLGLSSCRMLVRGVQRGHGGKGTPHIRTPRPLFKGLLLETMILEASDIAEEVEGLVTCWTVTVLG